MEIKWVGIIIFIISTMFFSTYDAKSNPGNVDVNVKVHHNGEKVIDASYASATNTKCMLFLQINLYMLVLLSNLPYFIHTYHIFMLFYYVSARSGETCLNGQPKCLSDQDCNFGHLKDYECIHTLGKDSDTCKVCRKYNHYLLFE